MRLAVVVEVLAGLALFFCFYTQWAALVVAGMLVVASIAVCFHNRAIKWIWNTGGMEYTVFWAITCIAVAFFHWN